MQQQHERCCPLCGGTLQVHLGVTYYAETGELVSSNYSIRFRKLEGAVFALLWKHRSRGPVSARAIHEHLYSADPNGGPDTGIVEVVVCAIRKKLVAHKADVSIVTDYGRGYWLKTNTPARMARAKVAA